MSLQKYKLKSLADKHAELAAESEKSKEKVISSKKKKNED